MPRKLKNAVEILDRLHGSDPDYRAELEREKSRLRAAQAIHAARTEAGITQAELAERVGTTQSVIARLEDANYGGHTMKMLDRIAAALGQRVELRFVPAESPSRATRRSAKSPPSTTS